MRIPNFIQSLTWIAWCVPFIQPANGITREAAPTQASECCPTRNHDLQTRAGVGRRNPLFLERFPGVVSQSIELRFER
jgi:hypothetical protein